jgi:competence protein ComEC
MTEPWLLVIAGGVTVGGLFGVPGVIAWLIAVAFANVTSNPRWIALALVAALAASVGAARVAIDAPPAVSSDVLASAQAEGVVASVPQSGPSGPRAVFRVDRVRPDDGDWIDADGQVLVLFRTLAPDDLARGDRLRLKWAVTGSDGYDAGYRRFVRASGTSAGGSVFKVDVIARGSDPSGVLVWLRDTVTSRIRSAVRGDAGALLAGFVTGDDSSLSDPTQAAFERTNMSHITAVSGSNVAVLLGMWFFLMPARRLRRSMLALALVISLIWLYVVLVGMGPGAVRAGLFATFMLPAARLGRRPDPLTALMAASAAMLLLRPGFASNVGFWLSLAASAAMVTCIDHASPTRGSFFLRGLVALVAAQVATLPITMWVFGGWSPASLIANLIVGPIVAVVFPFAFVTAVLVTLMPMIGSVLGWLPAIVANVIIAIVKTMAGDFSLIRTGAMPAVGIVLVAALSIVTVGAISADVRRWLRRVGWRHPRVAGWLAPAALGASAGAWIGTVLIALLR